MVEHEGSESDESSAKVEDTPGDDASPDSGEHKVSDGADEGVDKSGETLQEPQTDDDPQVTIARRVAHILCWLAPALVALYQAWTHEKISRQDSHEGRYEVALVAIVLIVISVELSRKRFGLHWPDALFSPHRFGPRPVVGRLVVGAWLATAIWGSFNYYQYDERVISTPGDYADATYYYLNSKYFDELGYTRLYHAMLVADDESQQRFKDVRRYRDLVGYKRFFSRKHALENREQVKAPFAPIIWNQFVHDVDWITSKNPKKGWNYFFIDHGYNPPPSWTLVGGTLARFCAVENVKWITMADFVLVLLMLLAIAWAFGSPTALIATVFFLCTYSGRWPILGQSLLRFDWLCAAVVGVCGLKKGRHAIAGWGLTYAALNRVFPAVFGFPYVIWMIREAVDRFRERRREHAPLSVMTLLSPVQKRFVVGALSSLFVFGGGAALIVGPDAFKTAAENLSMHGSPDSYSRHRVGLMDALVYEGEETHKELRANGDLAPKVEAIWAMYPKMRVLGALSFVLIALLVWFSPLPVWRFIWLGMYPVFIMTTPQINYFNMRLLLILLHGEQLRDRRHAFLMIFLFAIEAYVQWMQVNIEGVDRYAITSTTSVGLSIYFVLVLALFVWDVVQRRRRLKAAP